MNFGIIGTNFISDWFVSAPPFAKAQATAVFSRKKETGALFASRHAIPLVYDDPDAFLASDVFDAVYVASPNFLHESHAIRALRAGKHVLCEKPAAPSLAGYLRMCEVAKEEGRTLMEAMRTVHDSLWERDASDAPNNMHEETRDFIRAVRAGELLPFFETTRAALSVCDALRTAAGVHFPSDEDDAR